MIVKKIRSRGATITVESHAEILFMPGGSVNTWANRFTGRIRSKTIQAAPSNKRPRWAHYGKPLKGTIVSARPRFWGNGRDKQRVYAAVGSRALYAAFVDQGTGIHGGSGAYPAKILPPWQHGSPSLYEATWRPGGPMSRKVAPVMISGQEGQQFFAKGLAAAFRSMRMRSAVLPGDGGPKITDALSAMPTSLEGQVLGPTATPAFIGQLNEWRAWRDEAWSRHEGLGRGRGVGSRAHAASVAAAQARPPRPAKPPKPQPTRAQIIARYHKAIQKERTALLTQAQSKYVGKTVKVSPRRKHNGQYMFEVTVTSNGRSVSFWVRSDYQVPL